jgi:hypothetical protein
MAPGKARIWRSGRQEIRDVLTSRRGRVAPEQIFTYAAEPGTRSEEALNLLGSWEATVDLAETAPT